MRLKKHFLVTLLLIIFVLLFRFYFFSIDECFSDFCRHSKFLGVNEDSYRIELLAFLLYQYSSFLFYFFDLPFLILLFVSKNTSMQNKTLLTILGIQPSYDILFLIGVALLFSIYRLKSFGLLIAVWAKVEFTILVLASWIFYWKRVKNWHANPLIIMVFLFCLLGLIISSVVNTALINGPPDGKFQGSGNTIIRFSGYLFMPISSLFSYQLDLSWQSNLIRIQSIFLSFILFSKIRNVKTLCTYVIGCTIVAMIADFYQLRYVILFIVTYFLCFKPNKLSHW